MAYPSQSASEPVIRAQGEVLGPEQRIPFGVDPDSAQAAATSGRSMRFLTALSIAVLADAAQLLALPLFGEGIASPLNDGLDVMVGLIMVTLLGFHWQFLPSFVSELVPVLNIAPMWTLAVLWVRRNERRAAESTAS